MARHIFGGTGYDLVAEPSDPLDIASPLTLVPNEPVQFFDADGVEQIDFLVWSSIDGDYTDEETVITTDGEGFLPAFQGPDGLDTLYDASGRAYLARDAGGGPGGGTSLTNYSEVESLPGYPTEFPNAKADALPEVLAKGDLYVGSAAGELVLLQTDGIPGNTLIQDPEEESGLKWGTPVAPLVTLANMPGGTVFNIYWDTTAATWLFLGDPITERPTDRTELHMVAYGGSASPTFMLEHDVWFEETA